MKSLVLALMLVSSSVMAAPVTFLEMHSTGDYIVPVGSYYYDDTNSFITGSNSYESNSTYYQNSPRFNVSYVDESTSWSDYWTLSFSTHELGGPMMVGVYDDAVRFPFEPNGVPGLSISGNGRGNNTLNGSFEVLDIAYSGNTLLRFE